ncbi:LysR substrate-binding domain-containing protein, partial [Klebsiella pneumoniae]|nr:LysR substrate-binding domain-containing protein [Klebsiella pneumoniae]MDZ6100056.1 LysR substrate-binding domain-containing protein [Klebsiella pneumoniae]
APEKVAIFRALYPDVQVSLNDMSSAVQFQKLAEGQLQTGFVRLPAPERLESKILAEEKLVLAVAHEHNTELTSAAELLGSRKLLQLSGDRGEGLSEQILRFLSLRQLTPQTVFPADDI